MSDFIIAGERRAGTTTLYNLLKAAEGVSMFGESDNSYFIDEGLSTNPQMEKVVPEKWDRDHSVEEYRESREKYRNDGDLLGEKCSDILFWKNSHERIMKYSPDVKLIVSLRNPIERAWSHYWHEVAKKRENKTFDKALKEESARSQVPYSYYNLSYKQRGFYHDSLLELYKVFPREQVHIVILERLEQDREQELQKLANFLGVAYESLASVELPHINKNWALINRSWITVLGLNWFVQKYSRAQDILLQRMLPPNEKDNRYRIRRIKKVLLAPFMKPASGAQMSSGIKKKLTTEFASSIDKLEKLTSIDLSIWRMG